MSKNIKIKNIEIKIHDNSEYVKMDVYIAEKIVESSNIEHLKIEFHLIEDLKANVLIKMNIMKFEKIVFNFERKIMTISICKNLEAPISIQKKKTQLIVQ